MEITGISVTSRHCFCNELVITISGLLFHAEESAYDLFLRPGDRLKIYSPALDLFLEKNDYLIDSLCKFFQESSMILL